MTFYESKYKEDQEDNEVLFEENHPIKISYNKYYQQFYVATMTDIKIFDKYGNLNKRFKKLLENEHFELGTKIRDFIFDINYRKFYVGFSNGAIIQYNAGNGSAIKIINQIEYEKNDINLNIINKVVKAQNNIILQLKQSQLILKDELISREISPYEF
jgi:hypothetical protein